MGVFGILFQLLYKSFIVLLPFSVAWLAFRRLTISKSGNAWIYALTCLLAVVTTAGLLPWALGLAQTPWIFFVLAAFCPAIWLAVVTVCELSRRADSGQYRAAEEAVVFTSRQRAAPLVLENPDLPDAPIPVFRHRSVVTGDVSYTPEPMPPVKLPPAAGPQQTASEDAKPRSVLNIAREMRGRDSSDERRPRLLPSPELKRLPLAEG